MNRDELLELRDAIDTVLTWRAAVRDQVARWLAPEAAKPNGRDPHPPPTAPKTTAESAAVSSRRSPTSYAGKASPGRRSAAVKAEQRLLEAMRESPGLTVAALAKAVSGGRSRTGDRLRQLAARGMVVKDGAGRWRLAGGEASPPAGGPDPRPLQPPAA